MLGRGHAFTGEVLHAGHFTHHFGHQQGIALPGHVAALERGGGHLTVQSRGGHLAARHAEYGVVDHDRRDGHPLVGRVHQVAKADGAGVSVAAVGEHDVVGTAELVAHRERRGTPMRGFNGVHIHIMVGEAAAADAHNGNGAFADTQGFDGFSHQAGDDAVTAAGAVAGQLVQIQSLAVFRAGILHSGYSSNRRFTSAVISARVYMGISPPVLPKKCTGTRPFTARRTSSTI